jgi:putative transcriptional regulator
MVSLAQGRLLVATPVLIDANFFRTVILLIEHSEGGAVGLVLNRPSETAVADPLPAWDELAAAPPVVFVGGPVAPEVAVCLARRRPNATSPSMGEVLPGIFTFDLDLDPAQAATQVDRLRIFSGYAGWGAGQLEDELDDGAWVVVKADPADAHCAEPDELWRNVLRRQRGSLALLANHPVDIRTN